MSLDGIAFPKPLMLRCERSEPRSIRQDRAQRLQQTLRGPASPGTLYYQNVPDWRCLREKAPRPRRPPRAWLGSSDHWHLGQVGPSLSWIAILVFPWPEWLPEQDGSHARMGTRSRI